MLEAGMEPVRGYRLVEKLGRGGGGQVWQAETALGQNVALKFITCKNRSSVVLANEVRVLLQLRELRHPNIIELFDVFATANYLVLSMELAEGSLKELQEIYLEETNLNIPSDYLLELMARTADALDFLAHQSARSAHGKGAVGMQHCDVKPSNLLLVNGVLKVADFGLCKSSLGRTQGNRFIGTPPYAPPELYQGKVTAHTDQFSLAVTFCELATSGRAYADNVEESVERPIAPINLEKMRKVEREILARALDPDWTNRWENCRQFIDALASVTEPPRTKHRHSGSPVIPIRCG